MLNFEDVFTLTVYAITSPFATFTELLYEPMYVATFESEPVRVTLLLVIAVPLEFVILSSVEETVNVPAFKALSLTISRFVAVEAV